MLGKFVAGATALATTALLVQPAYAAGGLKLSVKDGKISSNGAAVSVTLTWTCTKGWEGSVSASVAEAVGDHFATGYDGLPISCNGGTQSKAVYIQAEPGNYNRPFRAGKASVIASIYASDPNSCPDSPCGYSAPAPGSSGRKVVNSTIDLHR